MIDYIQPRFVETVPQETEDGVLYISTRYSVAIHRCCCGCGKEVVTKISPTGWSFTYNGEVISLWPSIGNWNFPCKSHYIVRGNKVKWARQFTAGEIERVRQADLAAEIAYIEHRDSKVPPGIDFAERKGWVRRTFRLK